MRRVVQKSLLLIATVLASPLCAQEAADLESYLLQEYPDQADQISGFFRDFEPEYDPYFQANPYALRLGVGHSIGDGVGNPSSFTTFSTFAPLWEDAGVGIFFANAKAHLDNFGEPAANVGLGNRWVVDTYVPSVVGASLWYDYRQSHIGKHDFHQLGVGVEWLTDWIELRSNVYVPDVGVDRHGLPNRFRGNTLQLNRAEVAMTGVDAEIGVVLPPMGSIQGRIYGGFYHFEDPDVPDVTGWRARGELAAHQNFTADVTVADDDVFGTTVVVGLTLHTLQQLGSPVGLLSYPSIQSYRRGADSHLTQQARDRLAEPVRRMPFIVVGVDEGIAAADATTAAAFTFLHAVPGATGGDGSFERPYGTLTAAMSDPRAGSSIIYTPAGGTFTENVAFAPGARLLSNAVTHSLTTQAGIRNLPLSGVGATSPFAARILGDVAVADNSELDGFNIDGGVTGSGVRGTLIERNRLSNPGETGILLTSLSNTAVTSLTVRDNIINAGTLNGIFLTGTDIFATVSGNTATNNTAGAGIAIEATNAGGQFRGDVTGNTVTGNGDGIRILAPTIAGRVTNTNANITNNVASNSAMGLQIGDLALASNIRATITGNTANQTSAAGMVIQGASFTGQIGPATAAGTGSNIFNNGTGDGLLVQMQTLFTGNVTGNTASNNSGTTAGTGVGISLNAPAIIGNVASNMTSGNSGSGLMIEAAALTGVITANTANQNDLHGIQAAIGQFTGTMTANTANNNMVDGMHLEFITLNSASAAAAISGNTTNNNGQDGVDLMSTTLNARFDGNTAMGNDGSGFRLQAMFFGQVIANGVGGFIPNGQLDVPLVTNNVSSGNDEHGLFVASRVFNGTLSDNMLQNNRMEGLRIEQAGQNTDASLIYVTRTMLSGNNLDAAATQRREFVFNNAGDGTVFIRFDENSSSNVVAAPAFNFDLLQSGNGNVVQQSQLNNTGTPTRIFGSSDGSVTVPFAN